MSAQERIQKLEALLARINAHAAEPRVMHGNAAVAHAAPAHAAVAHAPAPSPIAPQAIGSAPKIMEPPPMRARAVSAPEIETSEEYIDTTEIEVSTEVVEVDIDEEEMGTAYMPEPAMPDITDIPAPGDEAPASSKRPIALQEEQAEEQAAADAYAENPPRHTPPPESGPQVAASPPPPPASVRRPSAPPAREEDVVSGWREPGLAEPKKATVPPLAPPPQASAVPRPPAGASAVPTPGPQVMRPQIAATGDVAKIEGEVAPTEASSFGDLLDTTLSI